MNRPTVVITGSNRGIGLSLVNHYERLGARVYAACREVSRELSLSTATIIDGIDVARESGVNQLADVIASNRVDLLINNAGVLAPGSLFSETTIEDAQWEMNVSYFGSLNMIRAFAPILKNNGGGAIVNLCSLASYVNVPAFGTYSAAKAALHSLTQATRAQLAIQKTLVIGIYPGPVDTRMAEGLPLDKATPAEIADVLLAGIEQGTEDIYPDAMASNVLSDVGKQLKGIEKEFAGMLPE